MDYNTAKEYADKISSIINRLNEFESNDFVHLNKIIEEETKSEELKSFNDWYQSVPTDLLIRLYGSDEIKDIREDLKEEYSVPFLHLSNNRWARAIFSKNYQQRKIYDFITQNSNTINKLSESIELIEQYADTDGDLSQEQANDMAEAQSFVYKNFYVIDQFNKLSSIIDKLQKDANVKKDIRVNESALEKYFHVSDEKDGVLQRVSFDVNRIQKELKLISIDIIQNKIKDIWKELKDISLKKEVRIKGNTNLQRLVDDFPDQIKNALNGFSNLQELVDTPNIVFRAQYNLTSNEVYQLKTTARKIIEETRKRVYPKLNSDHLTERELQLLSLLKEYESYPHDRDDKANRALKKLAQVTEKLEKLDELAHNRRIANFLKDEEFAVWINLEKDIYKSYSDVGLLYDEIMAEQPKKKINRNQIIEDFENNSAKYNALIKNITGEKENIKKNSGLPDYIIDKVRKTHVNLNCLHAILRPYQKFAAQYILTFKHVLLGDEMGLGKTLESLIVANHLYQMGKRHTVVVSPFSVVTNWKREVKDKTELPVYQFHGPTGPENLDEWKVKGGILLTNYEQCDKINRLEPHLKPDMVVVDEAHNIKNKFAQRTIAANKLLKNSNFRLLMTGTPLENNLSEMNSLISMLDPELGTTLQNSLSIGKERYEQKIATVYLRRKRSDVLKELPTINMIESWSKFNKDQQEYYDEALQSGINGFQKMRRAAFIGKDSEKIAQIEQICEDARNNGEKVIIFSFFKEDVVFKLQKLLPHVASKAITGDITSSDKRQQIIDEFSSSDTESVLVCQIGAAGYGLNIQAANQVIICEPQLKPSTESQAISRAYRMGQTRNVTVYHLLTEDSIDETMIDKLNYKQELFDKYADDSLVAELMTKSAEKDVTKAASQSSIKQQILEAEQARLKRKNKQLMSEKG